MLVLGVDPGIAITGYGLVDEDDQGQFKPVEYGVIRTDPKLPLAQRLVSLYEQFNQLLLLHSPKCCAVEKLFFQKNVKTATAVGEARGVIILALMQHALLPAEYTPNEIKQAVCGYGSAGKAQVKQMVQVLLSLPKLPTPDDAADALATAITHHNHQRYQDAIERSSQDT